MISVLITGAFVILVVSGVILFISPPGRIANWTNWAILGLRKQEWIGLHVCFSLLFLLGAVVHVFFNGRPLLNYFRNRMTRRAGFRLEWATALLLCAGVWLGARASVPPFSSLMAFNERVKESWDKPRDRAPIPHAELLTLAELSQKAGLDFATATSRLQARGVAGASSNVVVQELAQKNGRSAQQIFDALTDPNTRVAGRESQGQPGGHGGSRAGGGPGRKTLSEYCAGEGIELRTALARLQSKGLKASADQTMREIAVNNGYDRPYEILDLINAR